MSAFAFADPVRIAANGRLEMRCRACRRFMWLNLREFRTWKACPHCFGWWRLP